MRGGLERWKRGADSRGVRQAIAYALEGSCDSHVSTGAEALAGYSDSRDAAILRFVAVGEGVATDRLTADGLRLWVEGHDPVTAERRGRDLQSPDADLVLDGTINAPKSFSLAALIHPELATEFEALQDRLRDRVITTWRRELNARRGAGGRIREDLSRIEVVELQHRRSRALDPHIHRHLWLNVKVQGVDGKWSNVDSRVAMKLHTVINAEGELAARTDPEWIAALARHGYSLNELGEIAQLAHVVRPMSRRSNQIESNRAAKLAQWCAAHPGQEPSRDVLAAIDRWAWAQGRPNKPDELDESEWESLLRDELTVIDSRLFVRRDPIGPPRVRVAELDRDLLAAQALVDADARSAASGGRFSMFDLRAGAMRAVAASGMVDERELLGELIDDVGARAREGAVDLLTDARDVPAHVKGFMATSTATIKVDLAASLDELAQPGATVPADAIHAIAAHALPAGRALDPGQADAAAAIAGTDRLVAVTGPAGTGKTTMLVVAKGAIETRGQRLLVVAPTKKAATVAAREIGTAASSLHALLHDHGWRWGLDPAGAELWWQLRPDEPDTATGAPFHGPQRYPLRAGDRIVVDEAGMVDLNAANALASLAQQTGAGIAMVGDHLQARPVGHSGAMAMLTRRATAIVELTAVHRFTDPVYAALTLRMREPRSRDAALAVAHELDQRGNILRVASEADARMRMLREYFTRAQTGKRVALVTAANSEALAINEAIQQQRVERGDLDPTRVALGQGEQRLLEGDVVQTRRNDRASGVDNRAVWAIGRIGADSIRLASITDSGDTRDVTMAYAAEHVHLAYASTVHGIQGETTDAAIVGPGVDAAGLYVGMTRGRHDNYAIAIARTADEAVSVIADAMGRGAQEATIEEGIAAARAELGRAAVAHTPSLPMPGPPPTPTPIRSGPSR